MKARKKDLQIYVETMARSHGWDAFECARYRGMGEPFEAWARELEVSIRELRRMLLAFPDDRAFLISAARSGVVSARNTYKKREEV